MRRASSASGHAHRSVTAQWYYDLRRVAVSVVPGPPAAGVIGGISCRVLPSAFWLHNITEAVCYLADNLPTDQSGYRLRRLSVG
jgi:hypothetical protein